MTDVISPKGTPDKDFSDALDKLAEARKEIASAGKVAGGDKDLLKHYDGMFGVAIAVARLSYVFSKEFKGTSTDADIMILESVKDINFPGPKIYNEAVDSGITKLQYLLAFTGNGKDNDIVLGGCFMGSHSSVKM